jgi:hypothetical protein
MIPLQNMNPNTLLVLINYATFYPGTIPTSYCTGFGLEARNNEMILRRSGVSHTNVTVPPKKKTALLPSFLPSFRSAKT